MTKEMKKVKNQRSDKGGKEPVLSHPDPFIPYWIWG